MSVLVLAYMNGITSATSHCTFVEPNATENHREFPVVYQTTGQCSCQGGSQIAQVTINGYRNATEQHQKVKDFCESHSGATCCEEHGSDDFTQTRVSDDEYFPNSVSVTVYGGDARVIEGICSKRRVTGTFPTYEYDPETGGRGGGGASLSGTETRAFRCVPTPVFTSCSDTKKTYRDGSCCTANRNQSICRALKKVYKDHACCSS